MFPVSVVIITKNEESNIEDALRSIADADEIVVVDTGCHDVHQHVFRSDHRCRDDLTLPGGLRRRSRPASPSARSHSTPSSRAS